MKGLMGWKVEWGERWLGWDGPGKIKITTGLYKVGPIIGF